MANDVQIRVGMQNAASPELRKLLGDANNAASAFKQMFGAFTLGNIAANAIYRLKDAVVGLFEDGFNAIESVKMSTASLASMITMFAEGSDKDLAGTYKQAYEYSGALVERMEELSVRTVATADDLMAMVETMAQGGVVLAINNKKQEEGLVAIANALKLMTQGQNQDVQIRQEIRGLIDGETRATNRLAMLLEKGVGGNLKDHVQKWKEQGTLIENAGALLNGFQAGTADIASTWLAVKTTLETIYNKILRAAFLPIYQNIIELGKQMSVLFMDQEGAAGNMADTLRTGVYKAWITIKNAVESVWNILQGFEGPLTLAGKLVGMIAEGWGMIGAILPEITNRVKLILQSMWDLVEAAYHLGEVLYYATTLQFEKAAQAWEKTRGEWNQAGKKTGEAFASGFGEALGKRLDQYNKNLAQAKGEKVTAPKTKPPGGADEKARQKAYEKSIKLSDQAAAAEHKRWEESAKAGEDYNKAIFEATATQYEKDLRAADEWVQEQRNRLNDAAISYEEYQTRLIEVERVADDMRGIAYHDDQMRQVDAWKKTEDDKETITNQTYDRMKASMSDFLYSGIAGELENFKEIWEALWKSLARIAANALAEDLFNWFKKQLNSLSGGPGGGGGFSLGGLGSLLGGGGNAMYGLSDLFGGSELFGGLFHSWQFAGFHKGGYIPRFHWGGLSSDEIPAILQRGEYVVSRRGVEALNQINQGNVGGNGGGGITIINHVNAVDAQSFDEAVKRNAGSIITTIIKNAKMGGEIRDMVLEAVS